MALGSDKLVSQRYGHLSQKAEHAFLFLVAWCFRKLKMVYSWESGPLISESIPGPAMKLPCSPSKGLGWVCTVEDLPMQLPAPVDPKCLSLQPCAPLIYTLTLLCPVFLAPAFSQPVSCPVPWPPLPVSLLIILVASPGCPASESLPWVNTVLSGQEPEPRGSLVLALQQGWPQDSSRQQGKWAGLTRAQGVERETFSRPNPPRIALMRNSNLDPFF